MPVEEQVTNMRECVDAASSQWLEHHRHAIVRSFSGGFDSRSRATERSWRAGRRCSSWTPRANS